MRGFYDYIRRQKYPHITTKRVNMSNQLDLIIAVRHGLGLGNGLSEPGVQQAEILGRAIMQISGGKSIEIFTSPFPRAFETAQIIQDITKAHSLTTCKTLQKDGYIDGAEQFEEITESLTEKANVIVAVSHLDALSGIIHAASMFLNTPRLSYPCREIPKGTALILETKTGRVTQVPHLESTQ